MDLDVDVDVDVDVNVDAGAGREAEATSAAAGVEGERVCDACDECGDVCCDATCARCRAKVRRMEAELHAASARSSSGAGAGAGAGAGGAWLPGWSPCQVRRRTGRNGRSLWVAAAGSVYDAGAVASWHPGGERALLLRAGGDATADYVFHPERARAVWAACRVGPLRPPCRASSDPEADANLFDPPTDVTPHAGTVCALM